MRKKLNHSTIFLLFILSACSSFHSHQNAKERRPASTNQMNCFTRLDAFSHVVDLDKLYSVVINRKAQMAYPNIPTLDELRIVNERPMLITKPTKLSAGLSSIEFEEARNIGGVFDDYKILSDAKPLKLSKKEIAQIEKKAHEIAKASGKNRSSVEYRRLYLSHKIKNTYSFEKDLASVSAKDAKAMWKIKISNENLNEHHTEAFNYVENYWKNLIRKTPSHTEGSIIPLPYEFVVANSTRFDEMYYWDTYFGMQGLLATKRLDLSQKIVENFLYMIQNYGIIPNGTRDYYLTRSQPPFVSSMVRDVYAATPNANKKEWLAKRAYPLLKNDFENFWMKPGSRFDEKTGLHHHYDDVNLARPERHSADKELADDWNDDHGLGLTYRDTRAVAESGLDFTDGLGKKASQTANTLLNSMMYKYAKDLEYMAKELGLDEDEKYFKKMADNKKVAMDKYLWSDETKSYQNFLINDNLSLEGLHAEVFTAMYTKVASKEQAKQLVDKLSLLEKEGGVMSSLFTDSHHQWDGDNGWAPLHFFIIEGLRNYGYEVEAKRIAIKLANSYANIHHNDGVFLERIDVDKGVRPHEDGMKYPVQEGFLWTNGVYSWILTNVLNQELIPLKN